MTDEKDVKSICEQLAPLLRDTPHLATFVRELGSASAHDPRNAAPLYQSFQLWGGPGSLCDSAGLELPANEQRRMHELIVALFDQFEEAGIHYERANHWVAAFRSWLQDDEFGNRGPS